MLKDVVGFTEHQQKTTYSLGNKLTITRNVESSVLDKANATIAGEIEINSIEKYVSPYTPTISQQAILSKQFLSKTPTEHQSLERSVFMKEVNTQKSWTFGLGTQEGMNIPIWIIVRFQQRDRQDSQNFDNNTFKRPPVTNAQCIIGAEKYPDSGIFLNYDDDDDCSQGYGQIEEAFRAL